MLLTANEAGVLQKLFFLILLSPEVSKGVNDHAKDEVLDDDHDHHYEESEVKRHSEEEQALLQGRRGGGRGGEGEEGEECVCVATVFQG